MQQSQIDHEQYLAAFNQNSEHFRSLNQLMWQIPLIAMSLTGGLWFGVSKVELSWVFQASLLLLAVVGNIGLAIALQRLRFIMSKYLAWFKKVQPDEFIAAEGDGEPYGDGCFTSSKTVKKVFERLLVGAAIISLLLCVNIISNRPALHTSSLSSVEYYNRHARQMADGYEAITFEDAHPELVTKLKDGASLNILDVGSGTGRDAAWLSQQRHKVTAVDPSSRMITLAKNLHSDRPIVWVSDSLPHLNTLGQKKFDLIFLSAVWMHIHRKDRQVSFSRIKELLNDNGVIYITLRLGPADRERGIYSVSLDEITKDAARQGLSIRLVGSGADLLSRPGIYWQRLVLFQPNFKPILEFP
jgi:SAM-dependent methyltransferase